MPVRESVPAPVLAQEPVRGRVLAQEPVRGRVLAQEPVQVPVGASACIPANWLAGRQAPRETRALGSARAPVRAVAAAQWFSLSRSTSIPINLTE